MLCFKRPENWLAYPSRTKKIANLTKGTFKVAKFAEQKTLKNFAETLFAKKQAYEQF